MPEAACGELIVRDFDDKLSVKRNPFAGTFRRPAAGAPRRTAGEPRWTDMTLDPLFDTLSFGCGETGSEPDVIEISFIVVQTEQQRSDLLAVAADTQAAHDAIGRANGLNLLHSDSFARDIREVEPLGDHAIESGADIAEPTPCGGHTARGR